MKISDTDLQEVVGGRAIMDGIGFTPFLKTKCPDCGNVIQIKKYENVGDIDINVILTPGFVRISFSDNGTPLDIENNRDSSLSVKMLLQLADSFLLQRDEGSGKDMYFIDFLYEGQFVVQEFLANHDREYK